MPWDRLGVELPKTEYVCGRIYVRPMSQSGRNDSKLNVAPEVLELLGADAVAQAIAQRNHTDLKCPVCLEQIRPEDPDTVNLVVSPGTGGGQHYVVQYAHERCSPSQIRDGVAARPERGYENTTFTSFRRPASPGAGILVEPHVHGSAGKGSDAVDLASGGYAERGFSGSRVGLELVDGPLVGDFWLTINGPDVFLHSNEGVCEEFTNLATDHAWIGQVRHDGKAVMVVGSMGLDRPDMDRFNALLADSKIVAGVVPLRH